MEDQPATELPTMSTAAGLAEFLDVSLATLARWRANGRGPRFVRIGGQAVRYPRDNVLEWIRENEGKPVEVAV